ncbi:hypothetical protein PsorP6_011197 [Peronosclerospora sorghi]|uniref:Uncharacterized protein n=1 Tax=Peronosclerospora sorghi TaxID=230839 RepID=A0ACC0VV94_9STRA|nr:hypothetical protein PsorP6_011197 [Peronosclerospora sorghi]
MSAVSPRTCAMQKNTHLINGSHSRSRMCARPDHVLDLRHLRETKASCHVVLKGVVSRYRPTQLSNLWKMNANVPHIVPHFFHDALRLW